MTSTISTAVEVESDSKEALYDRYAQDVSRWVSNLVGPESDVEDLTHEVFIIAFGKLDSFRGEAKLSTWLYSIVLNVVRNHRRRAKLRRWLNLCTAPRSKLQSTDPLPDELLNREDRRRLVYQILDQLPEHHRTLLVMFEIEELAGVEIAEQLEIKIGTVWVRLHRARNAFAKKLEAITGGEH